MRTEPGKDHPIADARANAARSR